MTSLWNLSVFFLSLIYPRLCAREAFSLDYPRLIQTKKQANKWDSLLFLAKGPGKGKHSRDLWAALCPPFTPSHSGMPLLPTVVVSVEPGEINISSIRSGGLICLQWWQQWIPSRWFIPCLTSSSSRGAENIFKWKFFLPHRSRILHPY